MAKLTGSALIAHNDLNYGRPKSETVTLAGYLRSDGKKPSYTAYYSALMQAKVQHNAENTDGRICVSRIISAIKNRRDYKSRNDEVWYDVILERTWVFYHGNKIAIIDYNWRKVLLFNQGWKTKSTKDRLNRILMHFCGAQLFQKNHVWIVRNGGEDIPFEEGMSVPMI